MRPRFRAALLGALLASATVSATAAPIVKQYEASVTGAGAGSFTLQADAGTGPLGLTTVTAFSWTVDSLTFGLGDLKGFFASSWVDDFALEQLSFNVFSGTKLESISYDINVATGDFEVTRCTTKTVTGNLTATFCGNTPTTGTTEDFELQPLPDTTVPEPATLSLLGLGLVALARRAQQTRRGDA